MARYAGAWSNRAAAQALPTKWGTGWNPVHALSTEGPNAREPNKNIAPNYGASIGDIIPIDETDSYWYSGWPGEAAPGEPISNEDGWMPEDLPGALWGYSDDTGLSDRPRWDASPEDWRTDTTLLRNDSYPAWDEGGEGIRSDNHGANVSKRPKVEPNETVTEGWRNKVHGEVNDSEVSDPSQLIMQTSMTQRDKIRSGSQRGAGSASDFNAPIASRIKGIRVKLFSGGERHYDMMPRQAEQIIRPWWSRAAGVGPEEWLQANDQMIRTPITRQPPQDPDQGNTEGDSASSMTSYAYGYVAEDVIPYA